MVKSDIIIQYLLDTYHPDSIILYGSFADGSENMNSDFDALVIANCSKRHDATVIDNTTLDVFVYPSETFTTEYDPEEFVQVFDGNIILDKNGMAKQLKSRVLDYIGHQEKKSSADISEEIEWCEKMILRTARGDAEGYYRWHWLLFDSLEIYFDLIGQHYYGPKKALRHMEHSDPVGYTLYTKALMQLDHDSLSEWVSYMKGLSSAR